MIYNGKAKKQTKAVYEQDGAHKMKQEQVAGACQKMKKETLATYRQKEIKVNIEFPKEANPKAEMELESRLKEVYLRKIKYGSMQVGEAALQSATPDKTADLKINNLGDKDYE